MKSFQELQINELNEVFDQLQLQFGERSLNSIYGAGQINNPELFLIFMNPTAKNISAYKSWEGMRAPWLGTKHIWRMLKSLNLLSDNTIIEKINKISPQEWDPDFALNLYRHIAEKNIYITNIAKCTQSDARALPNKIFKAYLPSIKQEIEMIKPRSIISFGNQVSSILLSKQISVSNYLNKGYELLPVGEHVFKVYPVFYPIGQGMRNMPKAIKKISSIISDR